MTAVFAEKHLGEQFNGLGLRTTRVLFCFGLVLLCCFDLIVFHYEAQAVQELAIVDPADLEPLAIFQLPLPEYWDYRHALP